MSIEKKQPKKEFYSALDEVVTHQIKSREAFDRAIEIARKQNFADHEIIVFIKEYLKNKIPKTSLYRYLGELENLEVPLELIKDPEYNRILDEVTEELRKEEQDILNSAKVLENLGYPKEKIASKILKDLKSRGWEEIDLDYAQDVLSPEYKIS